MRKSPNVATYRHLLALSGNECAYPGCTHPIFNNNGLYVAQLCHISAAQPGGPRYNSEQTDDERRSTENLLFMCHRHHKETDSISKPELQEIKRSHESRFTEDGRNATIEMIEQIQRESDYYWGRIAKKTFDLDDLKIKRDLNKDIFQLLDELLEHFLNTMHYCDVCAESDSNQVLRNDLLTLLELYGIEEKDLPNAVPYNKNPFINRNWEYHNLGRHNLLSHYTLTFNQFRVLLTQKLLEYNPEDQELQGMLKKFQDEFEENYSNSYYAD